MSGVSAGERGAPAQAGEAEGLRLAAVVVTHERPAALGVTLDRLLAEPVAAVVVVDNASADATPERLAARDDPRLEVIRLPENRGGAGGFAAGLARARALDPDWTVVMDDDARPEPGALAAFRAAPPAGAEAAAAAVRHPGGDIAEMNRPWVNPFARAGAFLATLRRGRAGFHVPDAAYDGPARDIDGASFVGFFVSRAGLARAGLPDARLFLYGDDVLYTLGLSQAGGRIVFRPDIRFEHACGRATGRRLRPLWRLYYYRRNLVLVYRRAAGRWLFWPVMAVMAAGWRRSRGGEADGRAAARMTRLAIRDGVAGRRDRPLSEIRARAGE